MKDWVIDRIRKIEIRDRKFVCVWHYMGWNEIALGINIDIVSPNIEIHLPFGFIKVGWAGYWWYEPPYMEKENEIY